LQVFRPSGVLPLMAQEASTAAPVGAAPQGARGFRRGLAWLLSLGLLACSSATSRAVEQPEDVRQESGPRLPDFELEILSGDTVALSDHLGKEVILIDFWATYCEPCLLAMPHLGKLYEKYQKDGFVILGVNIDGPNSLSRVRGAVRKTGANFPILLDPETEALALYNPKTSAPYSVLIDRKGKIIKRKEGFTPSDVPDLEDAIKAALLVR
jgi:peroxiredoxin